MVKQSRMDRHCEAIESLEPGKHTRLWMFSYELKRLVSKYPNYSFRIQQKSGKQNCKYFKVKVTCKL